MHSRVEQDAAMSHLFSTRQCVEVDGFGHYGFENGFDQERTLWDWPSLWGVVSVSDGSFFYNATLVSAFASKGEAQGHATGITDGAANPLRNANEYILYGPLGTKGMAGFRAFDDGLVDELRQYQMELAIATLMCTETAFRFLPPCVRRRIYGFAYTRRASLELESEVSLADAQRILVRAFCRPDEPFVAASKWFMNVHSDATINDVTRLIHERLCVEDNRRPAYDRADHKPPLILISSSSRYELSSVLKYIGGARLFKNYVDELSIEDGEPCMFALMRPMSCVIG